MPGTNRKMPKKMRGGGMMAKPKAAPMKKGGAAKKKTTATAPVKKIIPRGDNLLRNPGGGFVKKDGGGFVKKDDGMMSGTPIPVKATIFKPKPKLKDLPLRKKDGGAVKKMRGGGVNAHKEEAMKSSPKPRVRGYK